MTERFTLISELGRGGMGIVWKARDEGTGTIVALKLLHPVFAADPDYVTRFERELELAKRIRSRNVVQVLGFGAREGTPYLALEFVDGPSLRERLATHGPYSWPEAKALLVQIGQGLADAHAAGVIHRDLKPANVLVDPDGVAKIADFGIAKGLDLTRLTATSTLLGTPAYLAPEGPRDARSDLYSLGVIAYELLTGVVPFTGHTYQEVIVEHMRTPPDLARLPAAARPIVGRLLAKNPSKRPQYASDLVALLGQRQVAAPHAPPRTTPTPTSVTPQPTRQAARRYSRSDTFAAAERWFRLATGSRRRTTVAGLGALACALLIAAVALAGGALSATAGATPSRLTANRPSASPIVALRPSPTHSPTPVSSTTLYRYRAKAGDSAAMIAARFHVTLPELTAANSQVTNWNGLAVGQAINVMASSAKAGPDPGPSATPGFSAAGSMDGAALGASAVGLLPDGRVLIEADTGTASIAETYDPTTGTLKALGTMTDAPEGHSTTLMSDGRVLIAGGEVDRTVVASAEIYDPATGKFTATGSMNTARSGATATLLFGGRVLIAGGCDHLCNSVFSSAELYDPTTGTFSSTGSMGTARIESTSTLLSDGRVLIVGGGAWSDYYSIGGDYTSAEIYDPATGQFSPTGSMNSGRHAHSATLMSDGRVLIVGGADGFLGMVPTRFRDSADVYDPKTGTFSATGSMATTRENSSATLLPDGRVLIAGGDVFLERQDGLYVDANAQAELYDPAAGTFSPGGSMTTARSGQTATLLADGRVLIVGGLGASGVLASAEIYQP